MALIRCYDCGKEISSLATACPSCGAPPRPATVPPPLPTQASRAKNFLYLNVREGAGLNFEVVTKLEPGERGIMLGTKTGHKGRDNVSADNGSWTDWVGKCSLHWSGNPSANVANGIIDNPVTSMNYIIQRPGKVGYKTYSIEALRVAVASGEVQLNWQARNKARK